MKNSNWVSVAGGAVLTGCAVVFWLLLVAQWR